MALVIAEPCQGCKDQSCVPVCPVDAIHEGAFNEGGVIYDQLFIDADSCICCSLCEVECPVNAIFQEEDLPSGWSHYLQINAGFYRQGKE